MQVAVTGLLPELSQTPKTINACPARLQAKTNCSKNKGILSRRLIQILMAQRIIPSPQMFWLSVRKLTKTAEIKPQKNSAVTNVGSNPTVNSDGEIRIETHIIGFSGDIYGKTIKIEFLRFLRGEKKFESLQELKKQIASDVENALKN